ncbi:MAG: hypothetical protein WB773_16860, partial [Isosphaeraceae bacterium]
AADLRLCLAAENRKSHQTVVNAHGPAVTDGENWWGREGGSRAISVRAAARQAVNLVDVRVF